MSEDQTGEYPNTPFWKEMGGALIEYRLLAAGELERILPKRLEEISDEITLPNRFVEIGGSTHLLCQEMARKSAEMRGSQPITYIYDPGYSKAEIRTKLLKDVAKTFQVPTSEIDDEDSILPKLLPKVMIRIQDAAMPNIQVPGNVDTTYNLLFSSLANYVDQDDLREMISDPRVSSVAFVNGTSAGEVVFGTRFHENRVNSTLDISRMCRDAEFVLVDSIMTMKLVTPTAPTDRKGAVSPVLAQFWVRGYMIDDQQAFIRDHQHTYTLDPSTDPPTVELLQKRDE